MVFDVVESSKFLDVVWSVRNLFQFNEKDVAPKKDSNGCFAACGCTTTRTIVYKSILALLET